MGFLTKLFGAEKAIAAETDGLMEVCRFFQGKMGDKEQLKASLAANAIPFHADDACVIWEVPFYTAYTARFILNDDSDYMLVYFQSSMKYNSFDGFQIHVSEEKMSYFYPPSGTDLTDILRKSLGRHGLTGYESWQPN